MAVTGKKALQSAATRRHILDVATTLFADRGYAGTSIEDLIRQAGVTRGALYHHFESKEALLRAVVADLACTLGTKLLEL